MVMEAVDQPAEPALIARGVAGIDQHKPTFTVAVLDERGGLHGVASFDTSEQGWPWRWAGWARSGSTWSASA